MGIHFAGYSLEARINALRWRPPIAAFAEINPRLSIRPRIRRRIRSREPSPNTDLSTAFVAQMVGLREVLGVSPPRIEEMQNPVEYQRLVDSLTRDVRDALDHEPVTPPPPSDPRLSVDRITQSPPSIYGPLLSSQRGGAGDNTDTLNIDYNNDQVPPLVDDQEYGGSTTWQYDQSQYLADYAIRTLEHLGYPVYVPSMNYMNNPPPLPTYPETFNIQNLDPVDEYDPFDPIPYDSDSETEPDDRR